MIKAIHVASAADIHAAEAFRTDFHLFDRRGRRPLGRDRRELRLGAAARAALRGPGDPRRRPAARERRRGDRGHPSLRGRRRQRRRGRARAQGPRGDGGLLRGGQGALASPPHERQGRGAVRPLRGPLRAGDADRGARRAHRGLGARRARTTRSRRGSALLHRDFIGRPTPLYLAERLSERVGRRVYLKREDLAHTGAHKINNAIGQALLAQRMGKPRVIAETGAGQHGVATATACALLGLECVVYMGIEDIRRQAPERRADGAARRRGGPGRGRRPHPEGGGQRRDPRLGRQRRDDPLRDRLGGRSGALPGAGPRPAAGDRRRGARAGAGRRGRACRRG